MPNALATLINFDDPTVVRFREDVEAAIEAGDVDQILLKAAEIGVTIQLSSYALAQLLSAAKKVYEENPVYDDTNEQIVDFVTYAAELTGLKEQTIFKYARMWDYLIDNPAIVKSDKFRNRLLERPITQLLALGPIAEEGLLDGKVKKILDTSSSLEVRKLRDQLLLDAGRQPRTSSGSAVTLTIERKGIRKGVIWAWLQGEKTMVGNLDLNSPYKAVQIGAARIINSSHILDRLDD